MQHAKYLNLAAIAIFEDDIYFCEDFPEKLNACLKSLPAEWDALWLNGTTIGSGARIAVDGNISRTHGTWGAFAYIVNGKAIDKFINLISAANDRVDGYYSAAQSEMNCFIANEKLALHRKGFSEIQNREMDYAHLR